MADFAVWAPQRNRVRVQLDGVTHPMTRDGAGWWRAELEAPAGARYAYLLDDDPTPLPDPRSCRQPDGVHGPSQLYDQRPSSGPTGRGPGASCPAACSTSCTSARSPRRARSTPRSDGSTTWPSSGVDLVEVLPVNAVDGPRNWGYDGVGWYAVTENYGGPDAFKRFVDACHLRGMGVVLDVVYNHLGPSGAYLDRFGPYFAGSNIWGPTVNLDGSLLRAGAPLRDRQRADVAARLPRRRPAPRRRARPARHAAPPTCWSSWPIEVEALSAHVGRPLSLIAESDLNDPGWSPRARAAATASPPSGATTSTTACTPRSPARRRATTPTSPPRASPASPTCSPGRSCTRARGRASGSATTARPVDTAADPRPPVRRLPAEPRPDRQPRHRRPAHPHPLPRPAGLRGGAGVHLGVHADAVHGRGVGRAHAVAVLLPLPRRGAARRGARGPHRGVRRARLGRRRACPTPTPSPPSSTPSSTGPSASRSRTPRCCAAPRADRAAPGVAGADRPVAGRGGGGRRRRGAHRRGAPRPAPGGVQPRRTRPPRSRSARSRASCWRRSRVEGSGGELKLPPESFAIVLARSRP